MMIMEIQKTVLNAHNIVSHGNNINNNILYRCLIYFILIKKFGSLNGEECLECEDVLYRRLNVYNKKCECIDGYVEEFGTGIC